MSENQEEQEQKTRVTSISDLATGLIEYQKRRATMEKLKALATMLFVVAIGFFQILIFAQNAFTPQYFLWADVATLVLASLTFGIIVYIFVWT